MIQNKRKEQYDLISISHFFPPKTGGLENMAYNLLAGLSEEDIRCLALYGSKKEVIKSNRHFNEESFKTVNIFNDTYPIFGLDFFFRLIDLLKHNPNSKVVIHSRHLTSSILTSIACSILKHPYTVIEHNGGPVFFNSRLVTDIANWVDSHIFGLVLQYAEDILAVSKTSKEWIHTNFKISKERIGIIYNSFNTEFDIKDINRKENTVVFASKWINVKDPQTTLDAYIKIAEEFPNWKFIIIGEGRSLKYSKNIPSNIQIKKGLITQKKLFELLTKSKIYINSSLSEGLALGIIEAVSLGNIPVLSDAPSNIEIADILGTRSLTFKRGKVFDLSNNIRDAIYRSENKEYVKELIKKNSEYFSTQNMVETYYKRLLPRHYEISQMKTLSIVIPVYNEERTIQRILQKVSSIKLSNDIQKEIIIIDDASKDDSRKLIEEYIKEDKYNNKYILLNNYRNRGKSQSVKKGVLSSTGELVVIQDADLEYSPNDLVIFVKEFVSEHSLDVIYGNRFNKNNTFTNGIHRLGNRLVTMMSNLFTSPRGFAPRDMETCYKMVRGDIMRSIFKTLESKSNFGLEPEITAKLSRYRKPNGKRLNFKQIDISYNARDVSQGKKMNWLRSGFEALLEILYFNSSHFTVEEVYFGKKIKRRF